MVSDLALLIKEREYLAKEVIIIKKPKKDLVAKKFEEEENALEEVNQDEEAGELEITDEDIAWAAVNKIWRTQENNPYERETVLGQYIVKASINKKTFFAPLLINQVDIAYDPTTSAFTITRLASKPDLNRGLIASLLPDDSMIPVRSEINEIFLESEEIDSSFIDKFVELLTNHIKDFRDIKIFHKLNSVNEILALEEKAYVANAGVLVNTPRTGSFVLDDLDQLSTINDTIENTPIEELLTVNFQENENVEDSQTSNNPKQDHYFFPLKSNIHQQRICDAAMEKKLTVVWGPPGTGKSETISNLVCHLIASGKSVLVTSQQPKALEVVRDKLKRNISLPAPKHPELTVPLELSLIRGQKESKIADDIRAKLEALSVYSLGIGSTYEINTELTEIKNNLRINKEKIANLSNKFSELKIEERKKYKSAEDSPIRIKELGEFNVIDSNEYFESKEQINNINLLKEYINVLTSLKDELMIFQEYKLTIKQVEVNIDTLNKMASNLNKVLTKSTSTNFDTKLFKDILGVSKDFKKVISYLDILLKYKDTISEFKNDVPLIADRTAVVDQIVKLSKLEYDKLLKLVKASNYCIDKHPNLNELLPLAENTRYTLFDLEQNLEIIKKSSLHLLSKFVDKKSVLAHEYIASIFGISQIDKRVKPLLIQKIEGIINIKKTLLNIEAVKTEISSYELISVELCNIKEYGSFYKLLQDILKLFKLFSELREHNLDELFNKTFDIDSERSLLDIKLCIESINNYRKLSSTSTPILELPDWTSPVSVQDMLRRIEDSTEKFKQFHRYQVVAGKLLTIPKSLKIIQELLIQNNYAVPKKLLEIENIVECHRLMRLYGDVVTETPGLIAKTIKQIESKNKALIHKYILFTRLKSLHEASGSRLANANLVKLKQLLGKKKKTLSFLKKKDSIDFSQVLYYFPCWIVSIDDISRYFPLQKGLFDYVIVDESSQCSQTAIPHLFYRAKNAIIVGDEKQLPSASLRFLQKGITDTLQRKYNLLNHDKSQFFDCKEFSLLTFAQAATPPIPLIEHFRCDPTIIAWSNKNVYNNMMKIMTPIWENRFNPPMEVRYIDSGSEDTEAKINRIEANEVLLTLKELVSDRSMNGLSLGVISPFRQQADYISELIYQNLSPDDIVNFGIQSRTVDGFQGDERDVILYSMRSAPDGKAGSVTSIEGGVNEEGFKRMNVAFTRARRKAIIFTSRKPSQFPGKLIKSFMEHAIHIQETYSDPLKPKDDHFDSMFEEDVCNIIRGRGINVVTQFECGGYRIDQVLFDKEGRTLALECDGDFKFDDSGELPPEHYQRQATIERITQWDVERLTASIFYRNPEEAIDNILASLAKQPTNTERKIEQYPIEDKELDTNITVLASEEADANAVLKVVESNPKISRAKQKLKKKNDKQTRLFVNTIPANLFTKKEYWFALAHWGKTTGKFSSFENRFCFSLGVYLSRKGHLTDKQQAYGEKIVNKALEADYLFEK